MRFDTPTSGLTYEARVALEAKRLKAARLKRAERRRNRHEGRWVQGSTIEAARPEPPSEPPPCTNGCGRPSRALRGGLCAACQKANRRAKGLDN